MSGKNNIVTLEGDGGVKIDCEILGTFSLNKKEYIAVMPLDEDEEEKEVFIYGYREHENGEFDLLDIEDDNEFQNASEELERILDEMSE